VDDTNWEDLEYAEENAELGRSPDHSNSRNPIAGEAHMTK
jgi:hypothetical protein